MILLNLFGLDSAELFQGWKISDGEFAMIRDRFGRVVSFRWCC